MTPFPQTVRPETPLIDAGTVMLRHGIRHLPVVDATGTLVGMLSDRDMRDTISLHHPVEDAMTHSVVSVQFDASLVEVISTFVTKRIGAIPVVDRFGAVIGIVSYIDALRAIVSPLPASAAAA